MSNNKKILATICFFLLLGTGYGLYLYRYADLNTLRHVLSALPPSINANEIVHPGYKHIPIHDSDYAVPGHYTIIEYRQAGCQECAQLDRRLIPFLQQRKDVAVRKIDLATNWSDKTALRDFGRKIWFTPFIVIYGPNSEPIRADDAGKRRAVSLLYAWLKITEPQTK